MTTAVKEINKMTPAQGFTADGYIMDQDCFHTLRYRTLPASINGCGWIAVYNLRKCLGREEDYRVILRELEGMHLWNVPGPTLMTVMRAYLKKYVPEAVETVGREEALAAAASSRCGIFRYREKREPHFISYLRVGEGQFRFFNVADGLEDCRMSMETFGEEHLCGGTVIVFAVEEQRDREKNGAAAATD